LAPLLINTAKLRIFQFCPGWYRKIADFPILPRLASQNCGFSNFADLGMGIPAIAEFISLDRQNPIEKTYSLGIFAYGKVYK
jgi:hypothetical protein